MVAKSNGPFRVILSPEDVAETLIAAEVKYLIDPEAGPNDVIFKRSGIQPFRPVDLLTHLGRDVHGSYRSKPRIFYIPRAQSVLQQIFTEVTRTRTKWDEAVFNGINNGVSVQELTLRLGAAQRVIKMIKKFSTK